MSSPNFIFGYSHMIFPSGINGLFNGQRKVKKRDLIISTLAAYRTSMNVAVKGINHIGLKEDNRTWTVGALFQVKDGELKRYDKAMKVEDVYERVSIGDLVYPMNESFQDIIATADIWAYVPIAQKNPLPLLSGNKPDIILRYLLFIKWGVRSCWGSDFYDIHFGLEERYIRIVKKYKVALENETKKRN